MTALARHPELAAVLAVALAGYLGLLHGLFRHPTAPAWGRGTPLTWWDRQRQDACALHVYEDHPAGRRCRCGHPDPGAPRA